MWASSIPNRPRMMFSMPNHSRGLEMRASPGVARAWPIFCLSQRLRPPHQLDRRPSRGPFRSGARPGGMNFPDARWRCEPEEGEAAFLSMNLTKAAMWEPARIEA